ncbi:hypothetical protein O3P69_009963 [Scylla paramamosain]|uniref:Phosphatidic acid phosphatase type 2/haloperoxidase domain-containing protein n=1 Tax=Scylla paramamosain TaxID=85552 RepID=A0AAW0SNH2_SCYPA
MEPKYIIRVVFDTIILLTVGGCIFVVKKMPPFERGMFCNDKSISYPFTDHETISDAVLLTFGVAMPVVLMVLLEGWRARHQPIGNSPQTLQSTLWDASDLTFVSICNPDWSKIDCNKTHYIDPIPCLTPKENHRMKEARLSFPSGHASFSAYTMVYLAIYLQVRFKFKAPRLLRPFLQFLCLMLTFYTTLSRISDYKHHWSDVLFGFILGTVVATLISVYVSDLFCGSADHEQQQRQCADTIQLQDCNRLRARYVSDLFTPPIQAQCSNQGHPVYLQERRLPDTDSEANNTVNPVRTQTAMGTGAARYPTHPRASSRCLPPKSVEGNPAPECSFYSYSSRMAEVLTVVAEEMGRVFGLVWSGVGVAMRLNNQVMNTFFKVTTRIVQLLLLLTHKAADLLSLLLTDLLLFLGDIGNAVMTVAGALRTAVILIFTFINGIAISVMSAAVYSCQLVHASYMALLSGTMTAIAQVGNLVTALKHAFVMFGSSVIFVISFVPNVVYLVFSGLVHLCSYAFLSCSQAVTDTCQFVSSTTRHCFNNIVDFFSDIPIEAFFGVAAGVGFIVGLKYILFYMMDNMVVIPDLPSPMALVRQRLVHWYMRLVHPPQQRPPPEPDTEEEELDDANDENGNDNNDNVPDLNLPQNQQFEPQANPPLVAQPTGPAAPHTPASKGTGRH